MLTNVLSKGSLFCGLIYLVSCASSAGIVKVRSTVDELEKDEVLVITRVIVNPYFKENGGEVIKDRKKDEPAPMAVGFNICDMKKNAGDIVKDKKTGDKKRCGYYTSEKDDVPYGEFFAFKVKPTEHFQWTMVFSQIEMDSGWFSWLSNNKTTKAITRNSGTLLSWVRGFRMFPVGTKLEGGKAYYLGTIHIDLDDKAFLEIGDEEYDKNIVTYVVPKNLYPKNEKKEAFRWAKDSLGFHGVIEAPEMQIKEFKKFESSYIRRVVTRW